MLEMSTWKHPFATSDLLIDLWLVADISSVTVTKPKNMVTKRTTKYRLPDTESCMSASEASHAAVLGLLRYPITPMKNTRMNCPTTSRPSSGLAGKTSYFSAGFKREPIFGHLLPGGVQCLNGARKPLYLGSTTTMW